MTSNNNKTIVASIDQGTTSTRVILFEYDHASSSSSVNLRPIYQHKLPVSSEFPHSNHAQQDGMQIVRSVVECLNKCSEWLHNQHQKISFIGLTNQRETLVMWDKSSGDPVRPAILWMDSRNENLVAELKKKKFNGSPVASADGNQLKHRCGLPLSTYFTATKIKYLLDRNETDVDKFGLPCLRKLIASGNLLLGTVDTWLVWNLTGGCTYATDSSNASRTMLMDLKCVNWSEDLLEFFDIPTDIKLAEIRPSAGSFGYVKSSNALGNRLGLSSDLDGIEITSCIGDQQASLAGTLNFYYGGDECTFGTGAFYLRNAGTTCPSSYHLDRTTGQKTDSGLLNTVGFTVPIESDSAELVTHYALEGSMAMAGSAIDWAIHTMKLAKSYDEFNSNALKASSWISDNFEFSDALNHGLVFIPAFSGLLAPYWNAGARGALMGLSFTSARPECICRAVVEGIGWQFREVLDRADKILSQSTRSSPQHELPELVICGGVSNSTSLKHYLKQQLDRKIQFGSIDDRSLDNNNNAKQFAAEYTAKGAAILAMIGSGAWVLKPIRASADQLELRCKITNRLLHKNHSTSNTRQTSNGESNKEIQVEYQLDKRRELWKKGLKSCLEY